MAFRTCSIFTPLLSESLYTEAYRGTWRKELGIFEGYAFTTAYQSPAKEIAV
jgi:hypothetical protein